MVKDGAVDVPATVDDVQSFVDANRKRYEADLEKVQSLIEGRRVRDRSLQCIYKIYTRGERQGGEELKAPRKIRLKFNDYYESRGTKRASLFDLPDIVGLTIVVHNPSDISTVAKALDELVDQGELAAQKYSGAKKGTKIRTKHGRPLEHGGYFACHYNVRITRFTEAAPVCEIQVKTLLHDAWGAKTHDLTYKPAGKIGTELLTSFELLGSNLANLDQQSDALRQGILRNSVLREAKRREVQTCVLSMISNSHVASIGDATKREELKNLLADIQRMNGETSDEIARPIATKLGQLFAVCPVVSSTLLCLLAAKVKRGLYIEMALESLSAREQCASSLLDALMIYFQGALAAFAVGDTPRAIDIAEDCQIQAARISLKKNGNTIRLKNLLLSIYSDLAYYHADLIGSHEGEKRKSQARSITCLKHAVALYPSVGIPKNGLAAKDQEIVDAIARAVDPLRVFFALDNEAFVYIQTAKSEDGVRKAMKRLNFLHQNVPDGGKEAADLAIDYHEYCSRQRLADLEGGGGT